jgi:hypothetical protein
VVANLFVASAVPLRTFSPSVTLVVIEGVGGYAMPPSGFFRAGCCFVLPIVGGCASVPGTYEIQAPYDSYVCSDTSFLKCLQSPQLGNANTFKTSVYNGVLDGDTVTVRDPGAGIIRTSSDGKYQCRNGKIPYAQTLAQAGRAPVVFVSPALLNQIGEQITRLHRIREGCVRTLNAYNFQLKILAAQDQQSAAQKAVQYLTAKVEYENIQPWNGVNVALTSAEIALFGLPQPPSGPNSWTVADALVAERNSITQLSEQLRIQTKAQTMGAEYKQQFDDAQLGIDVQLREIANELLCNYSPLSS